MKQTGLLVFFLVFMSMASQSQPAAYQKRLALIIGNSSYRAGMELKNPVNDARSMSETLTALGFDVMPYENLTLAGLKKAIMDFGKRLKGYDVGLFYYAGHGIQYHGRNYMIPIEAILEEEEHVEINCLPAENILTVMDIAHTKVNLVILDACRNNPFERSWSRSTNGAGLAMMDAPRGTLIAYATAPGSTASDGDGNNGLYTSAILKHIRNESLTIEQVFKRVRTEVEERSGNRQSPWEATSLSGEDLFVAKGFSRQNQRPVAATSTVDTDDLREAEALYQSGVQKFGTKEFNEALFDLTRSLELNPYSAETQYSMGRLHYELGLTDKALSDFTRSLALKPEMVIAHVWRGTTNFSLNRLQDAADDFAAAAQLAPRTADYRHSQGLALYKLKAYAEAAEAFRQALSVNPDGVSSNYYLGLALYQLKKPVEALEAFDKAVAAQPDHANALLYRALAMAQIQPEKAMEALDAAIQRNPEAAAVWCERGILHLKRGNLQQAADDLNRAIQIDNTMAKAILWKGLWFYHTADTKEALYAISTSLQIDSTMAEAYAWRGTIRAFPTAETDLFKQSKDFRSSKKNQELFTEASRDFDQAQRIEPNNTDILFLRSNLLILYGKTDQATEMLNRILSIQPGNADALSRLGRIQYEAGDYATASMTLTKALRISKNSETYFWRGECGLKLGFSEQSIQDFANALALKPNFGEAFFRKNEAYAAAGKYEQALAEYTAAQATATFDKFEIILAKMACRLKMGDSREALKEGFQIIMPAYLDNIGNARIFTRPGSARSNPIIERATSYTSDPNILSKALYMMSEAYRNLNDKSLALEAIFGALELEKDNSLYKSQLERIRKMGK